MIIPAAVLSLAILPQVSLAGMNETDAPGVQDTVSVFDIGIQDDVKVKVPDDILEGIKARAAKRHPDDYSTRLYVIEKEKKAYQDLVTLRPPKAVPKTVVNRVIQKTSKRHPDDYSTRLYVIEKQFKAYVELKHFHRPADVPDDVFKSIVRKAAKRHPDDYSTLQYVINKELAAYQKMQSQ